MGLSCASIPFLIPNPPQHQKNEEPKAEKPGAPSADTASEGPSPAAVQPDEDDFALALGEAPSPRGSEAQEIPSVNSGGIPWGPAAEIEVPGKMIRVALGQNVYKAHFNASESVTVKSASLRDSVAFTGGCSVALKSRGRITFSRDAGGRFEATLPCTLSTIDTTDCIGYGKERFRGAIVLSGTESLLVVNLCSVEAYLRGVVPLEMGKRGREEIEALKAQAIVARTYAYHRRGQHAAEPFDVVKTVADQVYGGAGEESPACDEAVAATRDRVLVWRDSLAETYYHSTCGGRTASIDEVWGKPACDYLRSVNDTGNGGAVFCAGSPSFTWEESWKEGDLSKILRLTSAQGSPGNRFSGTLKKIRIDDRFGCGRVKKCVFTGSRDSLECGGDRVRFLLRRNGANGPILRSANFTVAKNGPRSFTVRGRGYGHGVGMCQMGALGRARAGQNAEQILAAYFPGTELRTVMVAGARER
jgi:stage II sporulation protein D